MSTVGLVVVISAWLGQADQPPPLTMIVCPVTATRESREQKYFEQGLEPYKSVLQSLPYDTFRKAAGSKSARAGFSVETSVKISERYTLFVTPVGIDEDKRVNLKVRVEETRIVNDEIVHRDALTVNTRIAKDNHLRLGGLESDAGDLWLLISFKD